MVAMHARAYLGHEAAQRVMEAGAAVVLARVGEVGGERGDETRAAVAEGLAEMLHRAVLHLELVVAALFVEVLLHGVVEPALDGGAHRDADREELVDLLVLLQHLLVERRVPASSAARITIVRADAANRCVERCDEHRYGRGRICMCDHVVTGIAS